MNLVSNINNKELYYNRISDEIIRFPQIRKFILNEDTILFDTIDDEYNINKNEFIILEDDKNQYFTDLTNNKVYGNKYINNNLTPEYVMVDEFSKSLKGGVLNNNHKMTFLNGYELLTFLWNKPLDIIKIKHTLIKKYKELLDLNMDNLVNILNIHFYTNNGINTETDIDNDTDIDTFINNANYKLQLFDIMVIVSIYKNPENLIFHNKTHNICLIHNNKLPLYGVVSMNKNNTFTFSKKIPDSVLYYGLEDYITYHIPSITNQ
jgi:hypothetical protein